MMVFPLHLDSVLPEELVLDIVVFVYMMLMDQLIIHPKGKIQIEFAVVVFVLAFAAVVVSVAGLWTRLG